MYARLYDVCFEGFLQIYIGTLMRDEYLRWFMIIVGTMNIIYNLNNLMYLDLGVINRSYFGVLTTKNGKTQMHRLYNILIMYPIFAYVYTQIPKENATIKALFALDIMVGIIYNAYYFLAYS